MASDEIDLAQEEAFEAHFQRFRELAAELGSADAIAERVESYALDPDESQQEYAFDLLAVAITADDRDLVPLLVTLAEDVPLDATEDLRWSVAHALASTDDARVLEPLIRFASDPETDIRWQVACGIPIEAELTDQAVDVVLELMADPDSDVRDWATFAMATHPESDSPRIRAALVERLGDDDDETVGSAVEALAARKDLRALPGLLERLARPDVSIAVIQAAEELSDPSLVRSLQSAAAEDRLAKDDVYHQAALRWAIEACQGAGHET